MAHRLRGMCHTPGLDGAALARHSHRFASSFVDIIIIITTCLHTVSSLAVLATEFSTVPPHGIRQDQVLPGPTPPIAFIRVMADDGQPKWLVRRTSFAKAPIYGM